MVTDFLQTLNKEKLSGPNSCISSLFQVMLCFCRKYFYIFILVSIIG